MLKFTAAAALCAFIAITPALAADKLSCDDDGMMKVEMMMKEKMGMKLDTTMAMKESEMATMSKKEGKMEDCAMHLKHGPGRADEGEVTPVARAARVSGLRGLSFQFFSPMIFRTFRGVSP